MGKILAIGDLHGRHEICHNAIEKFLKENFDKLIFIGDYTDSFDRTNEDILRVIQLVLGIKEIYPEKVELLIGNHDWSYFDGSSTCSGFRRDLFQTLHPLLREKRELFKVIYREGDYLFSHAGIQRQWFLKHLEALNKACEEYGLPEIIRSNLSSLNSLIWTNHEWRITEVGNIRGGGRYDRGGPLWCDKTEIQSYGPIVGVHQVVGNTQVPFIERVERFEGGKHYNNTSVTFIDCLGKREAFLKLDI